MLRHPCVGQAEPRMEEEKWKTPRKRRDLKEGGREVLLLPSLWAADFLQKYLEHLVS